MHGEETSPQAAGIAGSPDQLERLFDSALDAVVAMDSTGAIVAWNSTAERIFGWSRAEILGRQLAEIIIPEHLRPAHHAGLQQYHSTRTGPVINARTEVPALRRDGSEFPAELTVIPLQLHSGEIFYAFVRDITARKQAQRLSEQRALEAQVLYEAASLVSQGGSADELLTVCLSKICEVTGWTVGHVYYPDDPLNPAVLVPTSIWHIADPQLESLRESAKDFPLSKGEGLPGRIWACGEPLWVEDIQTEENFLRRDLLNVHGLRAAFGIPILLQGQIQAVLEFFSPVTQPPDDSLMLVARSLAAQLGRVLERQRALEHQRLLLQELDHRVSNSLSVVASIFRRSAERAGSVDELKRTFEQRLQTLAGAHHALAKGAWASADLRDVIDSTVAALAIDGSDYRLAGPDIRLPARQVVDFTMVLHELATNAAKYGALSVSGGHLAISWHMADSPHIAISWHESGGPQVCEPEQRGHGLNLIDKLIAGMAGLVQYHFKPQGLQVRITVPFAVQDGL